MEPVLTKLEPFFSPRPWGAYSLAPLFPEKVSLKEPLGEAWLTAQSGVVSTGPFSGKTLGEAWRGMPEAWRGKSMARYADFPLLVKFIFPTDKLSIQVHPDDAYAAEFEQAAGGRGKTEMWHILSSQPGAELLLGLRPGVTRERFLKAVSDHTVEELFLHEPVCPGDTYFVPAKTQHAIGPGMVLCEVQEYSDLTYRVYDFGRVDAQGKPRELHLEKAMEVTTFGPTLAGKVTPLSLHSPDATIRLLAACEFFATERWDCDRATFIDGDSRQFQLIVVLQGHGELLDDNSAVHFRAGDTWFLPAALETVTLRPLAPTSFLRIYVPELARLRHELALRGLDPGAISRTLIG